MCGIAGFWGPRDHTVLESMTRVLVHRGPDDEGFLETDACSLGFRRLAIIDRAGSHQPMSSADGRVHLVYNGELHNFRELRAELESLGCTFATPGDTEVLLQAYATWGTEAFGRLNGMWAAAILDERGDTPRLVLVRDHYGIKPLCWARAGGRLLFASEIKALLRDPALRAEPNEQWLWDYLVHGLHDHADYTSFTGVHYLPAGSWAEVGADGELAVHRYWEPSLSSVPSQPAEFAERFTDSVRRRLVSEVPVGTCLSGGIDSSSIVAVSSRLLAGHDPDATSLGDQLKTFSIVYPGDPIDERAYMDAAIADADPDPAFEAPASDRFVEELDRWVWHQDEPLVSTGPYAQWCVMRLAAERVTVLLNGQGGDELLAGYTPYQYVYLRELLRQKRFGAAAREAWASRDVVGPLVRRRLSDRSKSLSVQSLLDPALGSRVAPSPYERSQDDLKVRLAQDLTTFSLPSLLRYEDRNSMAFSLESRLPFLDQSLVDWVMTLPSDAIVRDGWSRWILRQGLDGVLPEKIRQRRWKVGFTTPEVRWLRARRAVLQGLFRSPAFCARPWWDGLAVAERFDDYCSGAVEPSQLFWRAINTEVWLRVFFDVDGRTRTGAPPEKHFAQVGDEHAAELAGTPEAKAALVSVTPNWCRHRFATAADGGIWLRAPVRTELVAPGDDAVAVARAALATLPADVALAPGDVVCVSEKAVAVGQGRSFPVSDVRPRPLAKVLARFVSRTASGIGLGMPETMELALRTAGPTRILGATAAAAVTKPLGVKGVFYRVAGAEVRAIDGPTAGTLPPSNTHAKLAPLAPALVAARLAEACSALAGGPVGAAVVDANDIGVNVLGASAGVDDAEVVSLLRDNPMGQGHEQTPVLVLRRVGTLAPRTWSAPR